MTAPTAATHAQPTTAQAPSTPVRGVFQGDDARVSTFETRVYLNLQSPKGRGRMAFEPNAARRLASFLLTAAEAVEAGVPAAPKGA